MVEGDSGQPVAAELGGVLGQSLELNVIEILENCFGLGIPELSTASALGDSRGRLFCSRDKTEIAQEEKTRKPTSKQGERRL